MLSVGGSRCRSQNRFQSVKKCNQMDWYRPYQAGGSWNKMKKGLRTSEIQKEKKKLHSLSYYSGHAWQPLRERETWQHVSQRQTESKLPLSFSGAQEKAEDPERGGQASKNNLTESHCPNLCRLLFGCHERLMWRLHPDMLASWHSRAELRELPVGWEDDRKAFFIYILTL